jgi:glutamate-1-semialdehyde aminotransferase
MPGFRTNSPVQYRGVRAAFVTPADTAGLKNIEGARFIQVCGSAGTVTFRHEDSTISVAIPLALNQSFELGSQMRNIMLTGTTATDIAVYY